MTTPSPAPLDPRPLGRSGIDVSSLCLGGNVFGWTIDEQRSFDVLDAFVDGGGKFVDTADF
jgi:aryl-alcohol dehydrogenase-like predicted oxidoreductase